MKFLDLIGKNTKRMFGSLLAAIPLLNAVMLIIQTALAQPPIDVLLPAWVYVAVNALVVLGAAAARIVVAVSEAAGRDGAADTDDKAGT